jgi:membrane fusion protein, multidrug efflux system
MLAHLTPHLLAMPMPRALLQPFRSTLRGAAWLVMALGLALAGCSSGTEDAKAAAASAPRKPAQVGVVTLQARNLSLETELPGRTGARLTAEIRPQVTGIIQQRLFNEGELVRAGQVLYQLDPATYQAAFASAQASVRKAESGVASARVSAQRNAELLKIDAVSQQVNDDAQAALQQAEADLGVARAALETARITAPISGRIGLSAVTPGALVTASQATALATVQQLDPIQVDITQSSTELLRLKRLLAEGRLKRSGENEAAVRIVLEDGSTYPQPGRLTFSGVNVNATTGAITLRAVVPNAQGLLMPGMYVRAVLQEGVAENAVLVPQQGVTRTPTGGATALVVGPDNKVQRRSITVDRAVGNQWQVVQGLSAGERVLVEGSQRAKPGDTVDPVPFVPRSAASAASPGASGASGAPGTSGTAAAEAASAASVAR